MTKIIGLIPSRLASTRFPRKPLADILGRPMIWWTYMRAKQAKLLDELYVCTESDEIKKVCGSFGAPVIMTSDRHASGTDRLAEAATKVKGDFYVNVQGDEPMIDPRCIDVLCKYLLDHPDVYVCNTMAEITDPMDLINPTVPKIVPTIGNRFLYGSRAPVPFPKGAIGYKFWRQVCIYGFSPAALRFFADHPEEGPVERIEGIELMRFVEHGHPLQMIPVESDNIAVDTPNDLEKVRKIMAGAKWAKELLKAGK